MAQNAGEKKGAGYWGSQQPCLVIAEIAQAHDGSLGAAHAYIDAVAGTGASAIKFQTHIAAEESSLAEPWRVKFSQQDETRYDYWKRMEFTPEQWVGLKTHAEEKGLLFLSSPFSVAAVDLLNSLDIPLWKIASGEVNNPLLLQAVAKTGKPVILSSGMSYLEELDAAVALLQQEQIPYAVLQCTSQYPTSPEQIQLEQMRLLADRYGCCSGLSDHSGTIYPSLAAVTLGAHIIEVHAVLDRRSFGPDVIASVTMEELRSLCDGVRFIQRMMEAGEGAKNTVTDSLSGLRTTFSKGAVARSHIERGVVFTLDNIAFVKPAIGVPVREYNLLIGNRAGTDIAAGEPITREMILEDKA